MESLPQCQPAAAPRPAGRVPSRRRWPAVTDDGPSRVLRDAANPGCTVGSGPSLGDPARGEIGSARFDVAQKIEHAQHVEELARQPGDLQLAPRLMEVTEGG